MRIGKEWKAIVAPSSYAPEKGEEKITKGAIDGGRIVIIRRRLAFMQRRKIGHFK